MRVREETVTEESRHRVNGKDSHDATGKDSKTRQSFARETSAGTAERQSSINI